MRSATKTFVGLAGIGVLVATAKLGLPTASATTNTVAAAANTTTTETPTPTPTPTPTATKTPAATTKPVATTKKTTTKTTVAGVTKNGSAIQYRYGVVQVKVTKKSGKISSIAYLQKSATDGRGAVFPDLVVAAKSANGSNFGNFGGATYTTEAFKQALDSALAKF